MSIPGGAYNASFANLSSHITCDDSRRSEKQRVLRDQYHLLARLFFPNIVSASVGIVWELLGTV